MLKKWLILLLLFIMGLKNVSVACQPLVSLTAANYSHPFCFYEGNQPPSNAATNKPDSIIDLLVSLLDDTNASEQDVKLIDSQQKACSSQANFKAHTCESVSCTAIQHQQDALIHLRHQVAVNKQYRLPAHYNFLFRLTPF